MSPSPSSRQDYFGDFEHTLSHSPTLSTTTTSRFPSPPILSTPSECQPFSISGWCDDETAPESDISCGSSFEGLDGRNSPLWGDDGYRSSLFNYEGDLESPASSRHASSDFRLDVGYSTCSVSDGERHSTIGGGLTPGPSRIHRRLVDLCTPSPTDSHRLHEGPSPSTSHAPPTLRTHRKDLPLRIIKPLEFPPPPMEYKLDLTMVRHRRRLSIIAESSPINSTFSL
ncbi:MAG: hypothetical protein TREMPRED_002216 [Tremellales sp. Tagirdzhanova-0007]|nr:MAG: hypothetical protein TREMPRED_002216 [Tremellales sp. Tagirdzhanova-0007]